MVIWLSLKAESATGATFHQGRVAAFPGPLVAAHALDLFPG